MKFKFKLFINGYSSLWSDLSLFPVFPLNFTWYSLCVGCLFFSSFLILPPFSNRFTFFVLSFHSSIEFLLCSVLYAFSPSSSESSVFLINSQFTVISEHTRAHTARLLIEFLSLCLSLAFCHVMHCVLAWVLPMHVYVCVCVNDMEVGLIHILM